MTKGQKILLSTISLTLLCLLGFIVYGNNGLVDLNRLKKTHNELIQKNRRIEQENLAYYRIIRRLKTDPTYIEEVARQELGMIGKDEVIFKFRESKNVE